MFYVYIIRGISTKSGNISHYTGYTGNLEQRLACHRRKRKYCKRWEIVHLEAFLTKPEATKREAQFKTWRKPLPKENKFWIAWRKEIVHTPELYQHIIDDVFSRFFGNFERKFTQLSLRS